ncbi:MAG: adenylate kinase, partial [Campylobacter sp.]|nr:adenylate kinase [Campylobacter sp.]
LWQIVREIIKTAIENGQNLIIEGSYVPFSWRSDFSEKYLRQIRFIALAMSDKFIDENFDKIKKHSNDIENRLDDTACTKENLKADNQNFIKGFLNNGEKIVLIDDDYEKTINNLLSENLK